MGAKGFVGFGLVLQVEPSEFANGFDVGKNWVQANFEVCSVSNKEQQICQHVGSGTMGGAGLGWER